jgi:hypothetical protein
MSDSELEPEGTQAEEPISAEETDLPEVIAHSEDEEEEVPENKPWCVSN